MTNYTADDIRKIQQLMQEVDIVSLDTVISTAEDTGDMCIGDFVEDPTSIEEEIEKKDRHKYILKLLEYLSPREQIVIKMRYGLEDGVFRSLDEVGKHFNLTRERIRQIEMKAINKLKYKCKIKLKHKNSDEI